MSEVKAALIWCPFPDKESARRATANMLEEKLIACANIFPAIESVFEWEGSVSDAQEVAVLFKTTSSKLNQAIAHLGDCHPYDTPAIIGWTCEAAHPLTLTWLGEIVGGK